MCSVDNIQVTEKSGSLNVTLKYQGKSGNLNITLKYQGKSGNLRVHENIMDKYFYCSELITPHIITYHESMNIYTYVLLYKYIFRDMAIMKLYFIGQGKIRGFHN